MSLVRAIRPCAVLCLASVAGAQAKRPMSFADVMDLRSLDAVALSPDASAIVFAVSAWEHPHARPSAGPATPDTARGDRHDVRSHLWMVPVTGGEPRQLTFGERGESAPAWSPDGRSIAFLATRGTGEDARRQIWILPIAGGEAYQLSSAKDGISSFAWSPDGRRIAFLSFDTLASEEEARRRRRDDPQIFEGGSRSSHVWVIDVPTKATTEIVHGDFTVKGAPTWSPDGRRLAYRASPTALLRETRTDAYLLTVTDRQIEKISARSDVESTPEWSPDGRTLAYTVRPQTHTARADGIADMQIGNNHLVLYDVGLRTTKDTYDAAADVSEDTPQWTRDGRRLLFVTAHRAYNGVYAYDVATGRLACVVDKTLMTSFSQSADGRSVAFAMGAPDAPADVYVADLAFAAPRKRTDLNPQLHDVALGETEIVAWKSSDGTPVEGVLLKPVGYQSGHRYPLLVEAHGGPTWLTSANLKADWTSPGQVWAGHGWAVFYPNPRGSTGYGDRFMHANIMDWGGGDYRDIMTGVDDMVRRGIADSTKLALEGWSYGGYMTAWAVTQTSRFKAASMGAGLTDLQSMYGTTDLPGYIAMFFNGVSSPRTADFYRARSAITFADQVTTPLLILHGDADTRVPTGQSFEFYRALEDRGKRVELVLYPREWHVLSEYYHQLDKMRREYAWISRYTLGTTVKESPIP